MLSGQCRPGAMIQECSLQSVFFDVWNPRDVADGDRINQSEEGRTNDQRFDLTRVEAAVLPRMSLGVSALVCMSELSVYYRSIHFAKNLRKDANNFVRNVLQCFRGWNN